MSVTIEEQKKGDEKMKLKELLELWLERYMKHTIKIRTYNRYKSICELHLIKDLGEYELEELKPNVLQDFLLKKIDGNYSTNTIKGIVSVLKQALRLAITLEFVDKEYCSDLKMSSSEEKEISVFTKKEPLSVSYGIGIEEHDQEGRVITCEFEEFYFVTVYTPNSQNGLARLDYRMKWEDDFRTYLKKLEETKPVIVTGDMNVAHKEIDLKNPKTNRKNAGFTDEERQKFTELLDAGFIDTFRYFYPEQTGIYSWWSYRFNARKNNAGWRIDYFIVSECLKDRISDAKILTDVMGSDHCPIELDFK